MAKSNGVPEYARELVMLGLDTLAQKLSAAGERTPGAAKLAKMWTSLSDEERSQVGASIIAAAAAIPMTVAAIRKRRATKSSDDVRKKKKDKKKKKKNKKN